MKIFDLPFLAEENEHIEIMGGIERKRRGRPQPTPGTTLIQQFLPPGAPPGSILDSSTLGCTSSIPASCFAVYTTPSGERIHTTWREGSITDFLQIVSK